MPGDQQSIHPRSGGRPDPPRDRQEVRFRAALRLARAVYPANAGIPHTVDFPAPAR